jgi:hypothetical protein
MQHLLKKPVFRIREYFLRIRIRGSVNPDPDSEYQLIKDSTRIRNLHIPCHCCNHWKNYVVK